MRFELTLLDRKGIELKEGDIVKVSDGRHFSFYSEVKHLKDENVIAPFHTFAFHSFEKIEKLPEGLNEGTGEERYRLWYHTDPEEDTEAEKFKNYLMEWRKCEHLLERCCKIKKVQENQQQKLF